MLLALHVSSQVFNSHNAVSHKYCLGSTHTCMMSQTFPTSHVYMCKVCMMQNKQTIETVSPEGTFCDTVQIPSSVGDMELI